MSDESNHGSNPWGSGPPKKRPDKRERERMRAAEGGSAAPRGGRSFEAPARGARATDAAPREHAHVPLSRTEIRIFGVNACRAVYAKRRDAIRKAYVSEALVPRFRDAMAWFAKQKIGYRIVGDEDLAKLTQSTHHEGVCFEVLRAPVTPLADFLAAQTDVKRPSLLIVLDGVGNPHNFGAVLRSAANFGVDAILLPGTSTLSLTGAAARVAEGGAESVPLVDAGDLPVALPMLARAGYSAAATVVRDGAPLFGSALPRRLVLVFGAETSGVSREVETAVTRRLMIPGTGAVESLNIAAAVAIVTAEWWRQSRS